MIRIQTMYFLITSIVHQINESKRHLKSEDNYEYCLPFIQWILWLTLLTLLIISYKKGNEYKYHLIMAHVLIFRSWLPLLDWDQRCRTETYLEKSHFYQLSVIFTVCIQIINNVCNNRYISWIETFITICFIHIGLVRLGSGTCLDLSIIEIFT